MHRVKDSWFWRWFVLGIAIWCLISQVGCEEQLLPSTKCMQAFPATQVKIQPAFTKIDNTTGVAALHTSVLLQDRFGDAVKSLGTFRFELYRYRPAFSDPRGQRFATNGIQTLDLTDIRKNQEHWDLITRGYRIQLELPPEVANLKQIVVQVTVTTDCETRLTDTLVLQR